MHVRKALFYCRITVYKEIWKKFVFHLPHRLWELAGICKWSTWRWSRMPSCGTELQCNSMLVKEWGLEETLPHHTTTWNVLLLLVQKHRNKHSTQHMFISNGTVGSSSALFRSMVQANKGHGTMSTIILGRNSPYKCSIFKWLLEMKQYMAYYFPSYNRRLKFPFAVTEW